MTFDIHFDEIGVELKQSVYCGNCLIEMNQYREMWVCKKCTSVSTEILRDSYK